MEVGKRYGGLSLFPFLLLLRKCERLGWREGDLEVAAVFFGELKESGPEAFWGVGIDPVVSETCFFGRDVGGETHFCDRNGPEEVPRAALKDDGGGEDLLQVFSPVRVDLGEVQEDRALNGLGEAGPETDLGGLFGADLKNPVGEGEAQFVVVGFFEEDGPSAGGDLGMELPSFIRHHFLQGAGRSPFF